MIVQRYLPAIVVFVSVMLLSASGFVISLNYFKNSTQNAFDESASSTVNRFQKSLKEKLLLLDSLHSMYAIFEGVPQPNFRSFVLPFEAELEGVQALQWIVPVSNAERPEFEAARQREGISNFSIMERNESGSMINALERDLYFPVYPLLPIDEGESTIGYDLASSPIRYSALKQAIDSGESTASNRITLLQSNTGNYGFLVFKPLFKNNYTPSSPQENLANLSGLVLGVFDISEIFNAVLAEQAEQNIGYTIRDLDASLDLATLHTPAPTSSPTQLFNIFTWQPKTYIQNLNVTNRRWEIIANPTSDYMVGKMPFSAWGGLSIGIILAAALVLYLIQLARQNEKIQLSEAELHDLENQLFRSQKMEAIGRLVGDIAHDFNNLLTSIMGYAELASFQKKPEKTTEYLQYVLQGGEKGKSLIRKLLSFSRNEPAQNSPQSLPSLIENTIAMLTPVMPARISLSFEAEDSLPQVNIDPTSLDQIIVNLCINARDAIKGQGSISISLEYRSVEQSTCTSCASSFKGDYLILSIKDTGEGISEKSLQNIFKPFYTSKVAGEGTGLGLSIIHNITHGCRGHVQVTSELGKGTKFSLLFPCADTELKPTIKPES